MELVAIISDAERLAATKLLTEGFGDPPSFWQKAFTAPASEVFGHGYLLKIDGVAQGVLLMFEHKRLINGATVRFVNISSWYVREPFRSLAPMMLAKITKDKDTVFTDMTPTRDVQALLAAVRFRRISDGVVVVPPLPGLLLAGGKGVGVTLGEVGGDGGELRLRDHAGRGFVVGRLNRDGQETPFVFRILNKRGLRVALLAYCPGPEDLIAGLGPIFRRIFLRHGVMALMIPRREGFEAIRGFHRPDTYPLYVKGDVEDREIDLLYSEFLYLDL